MFTHLVDQLPSLPFLEKKELEKYLTNDQTCPS